MTFHSPDNLAPLPAGQLAVTVAFVKVPPSGGAALFLRRTVLVDAGGGLEAEAYKMGHAAHTAAALIVCEMKEKGWSAKSWAADKGEPTSGEGSPL